MIEIPKKLFSQTVCPYEKNIGNSLKKKIEYVLMETFLVRKPTFNAIDFAYKLCIYIIFTLIKHRGQREALIPYYILQFTKFLCSILKLNEK